jgi:ribosomal protein S24E
MFTCREIENIREKKDVPDLRRKEININVLHQHKLSSKENFMLVFIIMMYTDKNRLTKKIKLSEFKKMKRKF